MVVLNKTYESYKSCVRKVYCKYQDMLTLGIEI